MDTIAADGAADRARGSKILSLPRVGAPVDMVGRRVIAGVILAGAIAILAVGAYLHPNESGVGSHEQLGLPACSFLALTGYPCATCGMTTAVSHVAHGQLLSAFYVQPAGALFGLCVIAAAMVSVCSLVTGCSLEPLGRWLWQWRVVAAAGAILMLAWVYKILLVRGIL